MTMTLLLIKMLDCVPGRQTGMSGEVDGNKQKFGRRKDKACLPLLLPKARGGQEGVGLVRHGRATSTVW